MKKMLMGILAVFAMISMASCAEVKQNQNINTKKVEKAENKVVTQKEQATSPKANDEKMQQSNGIIPNNPNIQRPNIITINGVGEGVAPMDAQSPAQARLLAKETAMAVAYKRLAEKMYGIRLSAKDKIKDLMTQSSEIRTSVYGLIRGATIDEESWKNGIYTVVLVVKLNACEWSKYLTSTPYYKCGN